MAFPKGFKLDELTPKQVRFTQNYADTNSPTFGNAVKSYVAAGYKDGPGKSAAVSALLTNRKVCEELVKYTPKSAEITLKKQEIKSEYADIELIEALEDCKTTGDMTNRVALIRIYQQRCGNLSERLVVDVQDARQLEAGLVAQAKQIAALILNGTLPALPDLLAQRLLQPYSQPIDTAFESDNIQPEPLDGIQPVVCSDTTSDNNYGEDDKPCNHNDLQIQ